MYSQDHGVHPFHPAILTGLKASRPASNANDCTSDISYKLTFLPYVSQCGMLLILAVLKFIFKIYFNNEQDLDLFSNRIL